MARTMAALAVVAVVSVAHSAAGAVPSSGRVTYDQFVNMPEWQQESITRRHVRNLQSGRRQVLISRCKVISDLEPREVILAAIRMDDFYHAFASIFKGRFMINAQPELYVMRDGPSMSSAFREWSGGRSSLPSWAAGAFVTAPGPKFALFASMGEGEERMYKTLFHEGAHQLMTFYVGIGQRLWFAEGIATNFEHWNPLWNVERNIYSFLGESDLTLLVYAMASDAQGRFPKPNLRNLLETHDNHWRSNPGIYYAQAFAFMNYLLSSGPSTHQAINTFIASIRQREDVLASGHTMHTISSNWQQYLNQHLVPHVEYSRLIGAYLAGDAEKVAELQKLIEGVAGTIEERVRREVSGSGSQPPAGRSPLRGPGEGESVQEPRETAEPPEAEGVTLEITPEEGEARAREVLAAGLAKYPRHTELLYYKAYFMLKDGDARGAATLLRSIENDLPRHPLSNRLAGMAHLQINDIYRGRTYLRKAALEDPTDMEVKEALRR